MLFVTSRGMETDIIDLVASHDSTCGFAYRDGEVLTAGRWVVAAEFSRHSAPLVSSSPLPNLLGYAVVTIVAVRCVQGRVIGIDF